MPPLTNIVADAGSQGLPWTSIAMRATECVLIFIIAPIVLTLLMKKVSPLPVLGVVTLMMLLILARDSAFDRGVVFNTADFTNHLTKIAMLFVPVGLMLTGFLYWYRPDAMFRFPIERPGIWLMVMALYPLFSVIPQTIIYRAFFFHRYEMLFGTSATMVIAAGVAFGLGHIIFKNPIALVLTLGGGLLFAWRYQTTKSLLVCAIEHAIYGQLLFTLGYGLFLYHGAADDRVLPAK